MDSDVRAPSREGLLDRVFHGSLIGVVVAGLDDGIVLEANDAFCSLVGCGLSDILGANVDDLRLWGELGPTRAHAQLLEIGLIDSYDTSVMSAGESRIIRVWAEVVQADEPFVVIRAYDVDPRSAGKSRYLELLETEVRYRALVEQLPAMIYLEVPDPDSPTGWHDEYMSPQTTQILGYTPQEWIADPEMWQKVLHPDDREAATEADRQSVADGGSRFGLEYRLIAKDGRVVWIREEAVRIEDPVTGLMFWQGIMLDITDAVEAREHHSELEAKYRNLVEQLPAVVYLGEYGEEGDWLYISPEIERVMGFTPQEWLDHPAPMGMLTHPDDLPRVREEEERSLRTGEPFRAEYRMRRRDDRWIWILDEAAVVRDDEGNALCMQGLMYDITERKEAEERLVALDRLKNTLLHTLSHDLKEPLTAILGAATTLERLDRELAPADRAELLRALVERTKGMNALLTDLLDLDRLDRGIVEPRRFPVDLARVVREIVDQMDALRGHEVDVAADRCIADVDVTKVERMVENLLANAARHTPPGSRVWVRLWSDHAGVSIAVEDDGPGVPDDLKETIFEPFRRGPDLARPGSGIGLSLVARFAELHGGRAWVQDREGGGASFRVFLPASS